MTDIKDKILSERCILESLFDILETALKSVALLVIIKLR